MKRELIDIDIQGLPVDAEPPFPSSGWRQWWGYRITAEGHEPWEVWVYNPRAYNNEEDGRGAEWDLERLGDGRHIEEAPVHPDYYMDELRWLVYDDCCALYDR